MKNTNNFQEMLREQLHLLFPDFKESSNKKEVMINSSKIEELTKMTYGWIKYDRK